MRNLATLGVLLASCAIAAAQDSPSAANNPAAASNSGGSNSTVTWLPWMHSASDKPVDKSVAKKAPAFDSKGTPAAVPVDSAASRRKREEAILYRRNDVVMKLREIATLTGDAELQRQADDLQGKVWDAYLFKVAQIAPDCLVDAGASTPASSAKTPAVASAFAREDKP
jgi:hypothetical protein